MQRQSPGASRLQLHKRTCAETFTKRYNFKRSRPIVIFPVITSCTLTHLDRLGSGEVKPGRDKVMLRHLGPVFPVSGSRHQTSWPGSRKRQFYCTISSREQKSHTKFKSLSCTSNVDFVSSLLSLLSPIGYLGIGCVKVSHKTSQKESYS